MREIKLVLIIVFLTDSILAASFVEDKLKQSTQLLFGNCRTKTGATKEDFEMLRMRKIPTTKSGLCLMECLFEGANIMEKGQFNKNGMVIAFTPALKGDLTKLPKLKELGKVCENELNSKQNENCQTGKNILECLANNGGKYGLELVNPKHVM